MKSILELLQENRSEIYKIAHKYGILNVRVFGSVARKQETNESDIDLLVSVSKHPGMGFDLIRFERELAKKFDKKIDVISENGIYPPLKERILSEALAI